MAKLFYYIGQIQERTGEHNFDSTIIWSAPQPHQPNLFGDDKEERDCAAQDFMENQCRFWYGGEEDEDGEVCSHEYNEDNGWYSKDDYQYQWRNAGFKEISEKTFKEVQPLVADMTSSYRWYNGLD